MGAIGLIGRRGRLGRGIAAGLLTAFVAAVVVAPAAATDGDSGDMAALIPPGTIEALPPASASAVASPARINSVDLSSSAGKLGAFVADPAPPSVDLSSSPTAAPSRAGVPTRIDIPAIGVHTSIIPVGVGPGGVIQVPDNSVEAGWFSGGPRPGDSGPAVILGHVDSYRGPAVFFALKDLQAGDTIMVTSSTGVQSFIVNSVANYPKTEFPTEAVYGPVSNQALRLVTCGGKFDESHHSYLSNVIVFATVTT